MRMNVILVLLLTSSLVSCSGDEQNAEVKSVHDQYRMLGMIETDDGMYEFRLCNAGLTSFNAAELRDNCINPLIDAEGNYRRFSSIPDAENPSVLKIRNAAFAALMGAGAGVAMYLGARFIKRGNVAKKIVGEVRLSTVNKRLNDALRMNDYAFTKAVVKAKAQAKDVYGSTLNVESSILKQRIDTAYAKGEFLFSNARRTQLVKLVGGNADNNAAKVNDVIADAEAFRIVSAAEELISKGALDATDSEFAHAVKLWNKRNADILALAKQGGGTDSLVVNEGLQQFLLESAHGFKASDKAYLEQLAVLDEALDGRVYSYVRDGKRYTINKFGEPELFPEGVGIDDNAFMTISELSEEAGGSNTSRSELKDELKDRINIQRDQQHKHLKQGVSKVKKSIVSDPADVTSSRLVDRIKNRFKNIFKANDKTQAYDVNSVAKEIAGSFEGGKIARIYVPAKAQALAGQATAVAAATSFFFVPNLQRMRPSHAALEANENWSAIVSDFGSSEEVADLRLILKGLAQATNSHISTQVRIFGL